MLGTIFIETVYTSILEHKALAAIANEVTFFKDNNTKRQQHYTMYAFF